MKTMRRISVAFALGVVALVGACSDQNPTGPAPAVRTEALADTTGGGKATTSTTPPPECKDGVGTMGSGNRC